MLRSPWRRTSHWLATILLGISLLPPVATAEDGVTTAVGEPQMTASAAQSATPVPAAGGHHTLLLQPGGVVWTWGRGTEGQLGNGSTLVNSNLPGLVPGLGTGIKAVAAGFNHSLAVASDGTVWGWGDDLRNQVAGTESFVTSPVKVSTLKGVTSVAAGESHSLALKSASVWAWGSNDWGQLGTGSENSSATPTAVKGLSDVTAIAAGANHSLALRKDGSVWAWGVNNLGSVGDGSGVHQWKPVKVPGLPKVAKIAAGGNASFALTADGTLWGWGDNAAGQLGTGDWDPRWTPVQLMTNVAQVAPGHSHTLFLKKDGSVWAVGSNLNGETGGDTSDSINVPREIAVSYPSIYGAQAIAAGDLYSVAVTGFGPLVAWGSNVNGEFGAGEAPSQSSTPYVSAPGFAVTSPIPVENRMRVGTNKPTFSGVAYPKATVKAEIAGTTLSTTSDASGKFTFKDVTLPSGTEIFVTFWSELDVAIRPWQQFSVLVDQTPPHVLSAGIRLIQADGSVSAVPLAQTGTTYSGTVTAAAETVLSLAVDEPLSKITTSPSYKSFTTAEGGYDITLGDLKKGANKITVNLTDMVGKTTSITLQLNYETGPVLQITSPRGNVLSGGPAQGEDTVDVTFSGTSDESVAEFALIDVTTGEPLGFGTALTPGTKWSARVTFPATEAASWTVRVVATDAQGYASAPNPKGTDIRTITIDPLAPDVLLTSPSDQLVFTDGDDEDLGVKNKKLIIEGEAYDADSGMKQVAAGSSKATPARNSDSHYLPFKFSISLKENGLTTIPFFAEDVAGNKYAPGNLYAVMKTKIGKLSASGKWTKSTERLKITGATDPAINVGTKQDPYPVGIVNVYYEIYVDYDAAMAAAAGKEHRRPDQGGWIKLAPSGNGVQAQAVNEDNYYDVMTGKFGLAFDTDGWENGKYYVVFGAFGPDEFPDLEPKFTTVKVTIKH